MWDLGTIISMNAAPVKNQYIYDLGNGKFALGNIGAKATYVVRHVATVPGKGRIFKGVQARRPRITSDAVRITRERAGSNLRAALGL